MDIVELSRMQFALTAMIHFLFVPLTLGMAFLLAIMESVYVMTGKTIYRDMTQFWGKLFGINFALGVTTGLAMEFQFGTNWSYYSHYVGDIFGAPLAIEALMAFFLESTLFGLFFFGWERMSKVKHLAVTWLMALGTNLSALWILVANGWMQHPVGARFNPDTMRMEITSFYEVLTNSVAQAKFVHTVSAGYVCASVFVLGVSAWYLLRGRHIELAKRSMTVAASFGLAASLSVVVLGDESGYDAGLNQKMKMAAIEAMWETEPAPASFTLFGIPDQEERETKYAIRIPWVMGLIGTRSLTEQIPGIDNLVDQAHQKIRSGIVAYDALMKIQADRENVPQTVRDTFRTHEDDLGHALLLLRYTDDPRMATEAQITQAANDTVPQVFPIFWGFRIMVGLGFSFILLMAFFFWRSSFCNQSYPRWALWIAVIWIPTPWIAAEMGWIVAEYGRQPWTVDGVLPTALSVSHLTIQDVALTLAGFVTFYSLLFIVEMGLMLKYIRKGPTEDVEETEDWTRRHEARMRGTGTIATPAE